MTINELCKKAYENAEEKGFWEDMQIIRDYREFIGNIDYLDDNSKTLINNAIGNRLMLIVSELGEALEALRHNDGDNFKEELADVAIRLADLCGGLEIDLESEIERKMQINEQRPYKHGKAF
jgi:hypothetical protein